MPDLQRFIQTENTPALRWAMLTNAAAVTNSGQWVLLELLRLGLRIEKILAPEHGLSAQAEDGQHQNHGHEPRTGLPVVSLYGDRLAPTAHDLADIDAVVVDLPNIGCRFYTYWWTITHVIEACAQLHKKVVILDRPSWRASCSTEGPLLETECQSFLGRWPMPITHPFTHGELALHFNAKRKLGVELRVIPPQPQQRFVPPSPSIGSQETIYLYPATGLLEGVNLSEGRGTAFPFRAIGAPWLRAAELHEVCTSWQVPGVEVAAFRFLPMWGTYAQTYCEGIFLSVTDVAQFHPVAFGLRLLNYIGTTYRNQLVPRAYRTVANPSGVNHLDRLTGMVNSFEKICCSGMLPETEIQTLTRVPAGSW